MPLVDFEHQSPTHTRSSQHNPFYLHIDIAINGVEANMLSTNLLSFSFRGSHIQAEAGNFKERER